MTPVIRRCMTSNIPWQCSLPIQQLKSLARSAGGPFQRVSHVAVWQLRVEDRLPQWQLSPWHAPVLVRLILLTHSVSATCVTWHAVKINCFTRNVTVALKSQEHELLHTNSLKWYVQPKYNPTLLIYWSSYDATLSVFELCYKLFE